MELPDDHPCERTSPEEDAIRAEEYEHYREAVSRLAPKDRGLIVARIECSGASRRSRIGSGVDRRCREDGGEPRSQAAVDGFRRARRK